MCFELGNAQASKKTKKRASTFLGGLAHIQHLAQKCLQWPVQDMQSTCMFLAQTSLHKFLTVHPSSACPSCSVHQGQKSTMLSQISLSHLVPRLSFYRLILATTGLCSRAITFFSSPPHPPPFFFFSSKGLAKKMRIKDHHHDTFFSFHSQSSFNKTWCPLALAQKAQLFRLTIQTMSCGRRDQFRQ